MTSKYTGVGSRQTPSEYLDLMYEVAAHLGSLGYVLRSGHAPGADKAFEAGCDSVSGAKEIYLPWRQFEGSDSDSVLDPSHEEVFALTEKYVPYIKYLKQGAVKLLTRNVYQVIGLDLQSPSDFVLCWTEGGKLKGGTAVALEVATDYSVPVSDFGIYGSDVAECKEDLHSFLYEFTPTTS